jgi:Carboxypeptidase regulatory-like domain/TonB dependent receptor/TonB-dependent Receptor Plug Domain
MQLRETIVEGHSMTRMLAVLLFLLCSVSALCAQTGNASLTGRVTDQSKGTVTGAHVTVTNVATNVPRATTTNNDGDYSLNALPPGNYKIEIEKPGFENIVKPNLVLHTQDAIEINFELQVGSSSQTITVTDAAGQIDTSPAVSMTVTHEFVEDIPLNGRSFQDLIQLAPGTVSSGNGSGYYSIDGQRTDGNNFTVDGVSANLGGLLNSAGQDGGISGSTPSQTALGTTQSLVSIDALQEFKIQTSGYTAEYGRNPGGQLSFTTRSGTNDIHGTLFEYFRNTAFDANSYQNDYYGFPKSAEHQNDFGGTIGGPLVIPKLYNGRDKTFFFISYEGLRLLTPAFESEYVPTQAFRNWASPSVQPYLNSMPLPSANSPGNQDGCTIPDPSTGQPTACDALFNYGYSNRSNIDSISVRLDQNFGQRFHVFLRYADTPSFASSPTEELTRQQVNTHTWTAGATINISGTLLEDVRFNYSRDGEGTFTTPQSIGGSVPLARDLLIPPAYDTSYASAQFNGCVPGSSLCGGPFFNGAGSVQHQYQIVDGLIWTRGNHSLKFGGDWRRLTPTVLAGGYQSEIQLTELAAFQQGYASSVQIGAVTPGAPVFNNISLYAQDHWRISSRLSIDYGIRWEFNPPPGPSNGHYPATLTSSDLATATLAPAGTDPYTTRYDHFAPRFGFAWNAIPSSQHALTVRGGFGIFYDTGQQTIGSAYYGAYPFFAYGPRLTSVPFPLADSALAPPSLNVPLTPPYPYLNEVTSPSLTLPYTEQWNLSVDEALNSKNTLTVSYVGNEGKKLLFTGQYQSGPGVPINSDFTYLNYTYNGSSSNYNALQVQDRGRITNGLDFVGSFTWAHALDNASNNLGGRFPAPLYGNSDNDLREVFNLALNYQTSSVGSTRWERALTGGWVVANRFSTQSGYPLNVFQDFNVPLPNGGFQDYLPDLVPGVPIYLHGNAADVNGQPVPGNWRLNPAAFALVPTDPTTGLPIRQGTLGRNFVRGPAFYALNTAVQRSFPIYEELHLIFRVEAFNILNHPNLDFPDTYLPDSTFGQLQVGNGVRTIGVNNQLYAMGAPRSLQLSLKLQF